MELSTAKTEMSTAKTETSTAKTETSTAKTKTSKAKTETSAAKTKTSAAKTETSAAKTETSTAKTETSKAKTKTSAAKIETSKGYSFVFVYFACNQPPPMRLIISQFIAFLLSPTVWLVLLVLWQFFTKNPVRQKRIRSAALIVFLLFSNQWLLYNYARFWQPQQTNLSKDSTYSCGILLGGYGSPDGKDTLGYFNNSADRFIQAVLLYRQGKIKNLLITGGNGKQQGKEFNETLWCINQLQIMGIPDSVILHEDQSANTAENAANAKILLNASGLKPPYLLITSAYHMPRASLIFSNAGIPHVIYPCNYVEGKGKFIFFDLLPDPNVLHGWNTLLKETFGYWIYKIKG